MNKSFAENVAAANGMKQNKNSRTFDDKKQNDNLNNNAVYFPYAQQLVNTDPTSTQLQEMLQNQRGQHNKQPSFSQSQKQNNYHQKDQSLNDNQYQRFDQNEDSPASQNFTPYINQHQESYKEQYNQQQNILNLEEGGISDTNATNNSTAYGEQQFMNRRNQKNPQRTSLAPQSEFESTPNRNMKNKSQTINSQDRKMRPTPVSQNIQELSSQDQGIYQDIQNQNIHQQQQNRHNLNSNNDDKIYNIQKNQYYQNQVQTNQQYQQYSNNEFSNYDGKKAQKQYKQSQDRDETGGYSGKASQSNYNVRLSSNRNNQVSFSPSDLNNPIKIQHEYRDDKQYYPKNRNDQQEYQNQQYQNIIHNSDQVSDSQNFNQVNSPKSSATPLVMAMGRLHQQSSQQMRKFNRIQGINNDHNNSNFDAGFEQQFQNNKANRDSNSMLVNPKKQRLMKKYNMIGFDMDKEKFILGKQSNKTTLNIQQQDQDHHSIEQLTNRYQNQHVQNQQAQNQNSVWNQGLLKRNQLNIYNHRSNPITYQLNEQSNIKQKYNNPQYYLSLNEQRIKNSQNYQQNIQQLYQMQTNQQQNGKQVIYRSIKVNNPSYPNRDLNINNGLPEISKNRNINLKLEKIDNQIPDNKSTIQSRINDERSNSKVNDIQNSRYTGNKDQLIRKSIKFGGRIIQPPINSSIINNRDRVHPNLNKSVIESSYPVDMRSHSHSNHATVGKPTQNLNKSFNNTTVPANPKLNPRDSIDTVTSTLPKGNNQKSSEVSKSQQKLRKSLVSMKINSEKMEQLDRDDLPLEKRQEIIYNVLKNQLDKQRREILHYKRMKRELERAQIAIQDQKARGGIVSDKEMARIRFQQDKLANMSPQMINIIENLTRKRKHSKYCRCCKHDEVLRNDQFQGQELKQSYDPTEMTEYMRRIKMLNDRLYGVKSQKNLVNSNQKNTDRISLRDLAYHESRNDNKFSNTKQTHTKNISDNSFVNMGSHFRKSSHTQNNFHTQDQKRKQSIASNALQNTGVFQRGHSPETRSIMSNNNKSQYSREARERLLGNYNKHRHICSTNHSMNGPVARFPQSARKSRGERTNQIEYIDLELKPISEPPSVRSICLSALDFSYRDMSQQVDEISKHEQFMQTQAAEARSIQMATIYSGKLVDKCIETEKEIMIKNIPTKKVFGIISMSGELDHDEPEYINYDWKSSGLYQLIRDQYDEMRAGKDLLTSQQSMGLIKNQRNPNEDYEENLQDASASQYTKNEIKNRELDLQNLNPDDEDIYTDMEVQYMASLLKKKAQTYNQLEILSEIHIKAMKTLEVLNNNLVAGDISINSIFNFYKEPKRENIIRLLLRCKKMYEARVDVKKIILLLITMQEQFKDIEILRELEVKKYKRGDMETFQNGMKLLQRIQRELNIFKEDHKIFKARFIFNNKDQYNEIPISVEDLQLFIQSIKQIPLSVDEDIMRESKSSLKLKKLNPKAYIETFKVLEEETKSLLTESKAGHTQLLSNHHYNDGSALGIENQSLEDREVDIIQYSLDGDEQRQNLDQQQNKQQTRKMQRQIEIDYEDEEDQVDLQKFSQIHTPKIEVKYDERNLIIPARKIKDGKEVKVQEIIKKQQNESLSQLNSLDQPLIQIVNQRRQETLQNQNDNRISIQSKSHQNLNSQEIASQPKNTNKDVNPNIIPKEQQQQFNSTRTSQMTRIIDQNRHLEGPIQEEVYQLTTSQINDKDDENHQDDDSIAYQEFQNFDVNSDIGNQRVRVGQKPHTSNGKVKKHNQGKYQSIDTQRIENQDNFQHLSSNKTIKIEKDQHKHVVNETKMLKNQVNSHKNLVNQRNGDDNDNDDSSLGMNRQQFNTLSDDNGSQSNLQTKIYNM